MSTAEKSTRPHGQRRRGSTDARPEEELRRIHNSTGHIACKYLWKEMAGRQQRTVTWDEYEENYSPVFFVVVLIDWWSLAAACRWAEYSQNVSISFPHTIPASTVVPCGKSSNNFT